MSDLEVVDCMRHIIKAQADLIYDLYVMLEQASLTGPGVDDATARAAAISEEIKAIDADIGAPGPITAAMAAKIMAANAKGGRG